MSKANSPVTFIKTGKISFNIAIPVGRTEEERAKNALVRRANNGRLIQFHHNASTGLADPRCTFTTADPLVKKYLLEWSKRAKSPLKVDVSMVPLECMQCNFKTEDGSDASRQELTLHILAEHSNEEEDGSDVGLDIDADGKLVDPDSHKLADLKQIAVDAGGDEDVVESIKSKQGVVDYMAENIPGFVPEAE